MADNKKSVLLYCDIIHTVEELSDEEAGKLFKHYLRYINDLNPIAPDKLTQIVFEPIKQNLKRDLKTWKLKLKKRSEAGKKGMESRWNDNNVINSITNDNNVIKPITNITDTVTVKDKVTVKEINNTDNFPQMPKPEDCGELPEQVMKDCVEAYQLKNYKKITIDQVRRYWPIWLRTEYNGTKWAPNIEAVRTHFFRAIKNEKFEESKIENGNPLADKIRADLKAAGR